MVAGAAQARAGAQIVVKVSMFFSELVHEDGDIEEQPNLLFYIQDVKERDAYMLVKPTIVPALTNSTLNDSRRWSELY